MASTYLDLGSCEDPADPGDYAGELGELADEARQQVRTFRDRARRVEQQQRDFRALEGKTAIPRGPESQRLARNLVARYGSVRGALQSAFGVGPSDGKAYLARRRELERQVAGTRGIGVEYAGLYRASVPRQVREAKIPEPRLRISFDGRQGDVCICSGPGAADCRARRLPPVVVPVEDTDAALDDPLAYYLDNWGGPSFVGSGTLRVDFRI